MGKRRLISDVNGTKTYHTYDEATGQNILESIQDAEPFIDRSRILAAGLNKKEDWWYIGSVPDTIILQWAHECNSRPYSKEWHKYAMKQLNSAEYRKFNPNRIKL